jgi:hypothetical protein
MKNLFSMPGLLWVFVSAAGLTIIFRGLKIALEKTGWKSKRKIFLRSIIIVLAWIIFLSILSINNFFSNFSKLPPRLLLPIVFPLPFVLIIAFSKKGTELLQSLPQHWPVFFQSFRIFVEILLWLAFLKNLMPVQMTFEGRNFDLLTGIFALPIGYVLMQRKSYSTKLAIAYNILGLALLLNVLVIAMLSMPTPMRYFMNDPANTLVAEFPFIFLPGILVPMAYSMHIFSLRKLLFEKKASGKWQVASAA